MQLKYSESMVSDIEGGNINIYTSYWMMTQFGGKPKWKTLKHSGVLFPPDYVKHNVPIKYKGININLDGLAEEYATLYAKYIETEYINNSVFKKNFWKDWKQTLGKDHIIQNLENCDFRPIYEHLLKVKAEKKLSNEINGEEKKKKDEYESKYKIALVDGKEEPVGNFRIESSGILIGRGCNPLLGRIKRRIMPEDVIINIGKGEDIPIPMPGHSWQKVIHDNHVSWLASWRDTITGKMKYVWLAAHSKMKEDSDIKKFETARKLKKKIETIRKENEDNLKSDDVKLKQVAVATYLVDNFAIRIGNEKGEQGADTVGITTLRCEHVGFQENNKVKLDFLGKDSIRYKRVLDVIPIVYDNIKGFCENKTPKQQIFDQINSNDVNKYLQTFLKGLTAKVFRTYNATNLFQKELQKATTKYATYEEADKINLLLDEFNKANAKVAFLCNHYKAESKSSGKQIEKINEMIKKQKTLLNKAKKTGNKDRIARIQGKIKKLKAKKDMKIELKNIALGTSKTNYISPRVAVAFLKKNDIPIEKVFSKTLQDRFLWAMDTEADYVF